MTLVLRWRGMTVYTMGCSVSRPMWRI